MQGLSRLWWCFGPLVTCFPEVHVHGRLDVCKGSQLPSRSGGRWRWLRLLVVLCSLRTADTVPLVPVQFQSTELPPTTVGGVVETSLPVRTQGRTMGCAITLTTRYRCRVWFSSVVARSAARTRCDFGGHESWLRGWSAPRSTPQQSV